MAEVLDDDYLDDPEVIALQEQDLSGREKKSTDHELIMATMKGGETWRARHDAEEERLRSERIAALRQERATPIYVRSVGAVAMLETLRKAKSSFVVVHVSKAENQDCLVLNKAMANLELRMRNNPTDSRFVGTARPIFLQLDADDAGGVMHQVDLSLLPALLIYQNEQLIATKFHLILHDDDSADDQLEDILDELGLFGR